MRNITLRNRIGVSPMCMYSYQGGFSNDWQVIHLGARAAGSAGLIIAEATAVDPIGRITPYDIGLWSDEHIDPLVRVTRAIKNSRAVPGIQIAYAGRKAGSRRPWNIGKPRQPDELPSWQGVGPSPIAFNGDYEVPHELSVEEIRAVQTFSSMVKTTPS